MSSMQSLDMDSAIYAQLYPFSSSLSLSKHMGDKSVAAHEPAVPVPLDNAEFRPMTTFAFFSLLRKLDVHFVSTDEHRVVNISANLIGRGGFGEITYARLKSYQYPGEEGTEVAIKSLARSRDGGDDFSKAGQQSI